jgi:uncharacterized repeat protein (TIGR03803 family)
MTYLPSSFAPASAHTGTKPISHKSAFLCMAAIVSLAMAAVPSALAQTYTVLSTFQTSGAAVVSFQGSDGNFYGLEEGVPTIGGCDPNPSFPCGALLQLTAGGTLSNPYSFSYSTGELPDILIQGTDGNFYGVTTNGGTGSGCFFDAPCGTIFSVTPQGLTPLYNSSLPGDGPITSLVAGSDGNLYGTSQFGGSNNWNSCTIGNPNDMPQGCGTFFQITPSGTLTTLYSFCSQTNCADGYFPSNLVAGTDGNFYGFTYGFIDGDGNAGGTFFQVTPQGALTTIYSFPASGSGMVRENQFRDGGSHMRRNLPRLIPGGTLKASQPKGSGTNREDGGNVQVFYGVVTTSSNDAWPANAGLVFQITSAGTYSVLYNFCSQANCADGGWPSAIVLATDLNLYGTTLQGGTGAYCPMSGGVGCGTIFKLTPAGQLTTVYNFCSLPNCSDGYSLGYPSFLVTQAADTVFYGVAYQPHNDAVFYSLSNGLNGPSPSATNLSLSSSTVTAGPNSVTLTATVAPQSGGGTPIGTVAFSNGSTDIGTAPLVSGVGTFSYDVSELTVGAYKISAAYSGDVVHAVSNSSAETLTVSAAPAADFQFAANSTSLTIAAGQSAKTTLTVTPQNGFNSQVTFSCSELPSGVTCAFSPASVTPTGSRAATTTLTIGTTTTAALQPVSGSRVRWTYALLLPCFGMIFCGLRSSRRLSQRLTVLGMLTVLAVTAELSACGGSSSTTKQTQFQSTQANVAVTATTGGSPAITHSVTLSVTITQ